MSNSAAIVDLDGSNFDQVALAGDLPVVVDFWAPWCGPCKALGPTVDQVAEETAGKAVVAKVNIDDAPEIASRFGVMAVPTLLFFKGGAETDRVTGRDTVEGMKKKLGV